MNLIKLTLNHLTTQGKKMVGYLRLSPHLISAYLYLKDLSFSIFITQNFFVKHSC